MKTCRGVLQSEPEASELCRGEDDAEEVRDEQREVAARDLPGDHQVDGRNLVLGELRFVIFGGRCEDSRKDLRVEGLDPTVENLGETGVIAHSDHFAANFTQSARRAAGGQVGGGAQVELRCGYLSAEPSDVPPPKEQA